MNLESSMIQFETKVASCEITMEEITLQCGICSHILSVDAVNAHQCADVNNNDGANSDVPSDYLKQDIYTVSQIPQSFSRGISTQRGEIHVSNIGGQFKPHLWRSSDVTGSGITESREPKPEMKGR